MGRQRLRGRSCRPLSHASRRRCGLSAYCLVVSMLEATATSCSSWVGDACCLRASMFVAETWTNTLLHITNLFSNCPPQAASLQEDLEREKASCSAYVEGG